MHQYGLISQINTTQDQGLGICEHEAIKPHRISPSFWKNRFCWFYTFKICDSILVCHTLLSTFMSLFKKIKKKHQLQGVMSVSHHHFQRLPGHCLLFKPRLRLLFNISFGRHAGFPPSLGEGSRAISSILIEDKSMIIFGHLQWRGISTALAGIRHIMDQWKIPPFDGYSIIH